MDRDMIMTPIYALARIVAYLLLELILTMLVYIGLNAWSLSVFGALVGFAGGVLELMRALINKLLPGMANIANATLFGELGPKATLLLLIGLVVAAIIRSVARLFERH